MKLVSQPTLSCFLTAWMKIRWPGSTSLPGSSAKSSIPLKSRDSCSLILIPLFLIPSQIDLIFFNRESPPFFGLYFCQARHRGGLGFSLIRHYMHRIYDWMIHRYDSTKIFPFSMSIHLL